MDISPERITELKEIVPTIVGSNIRTERTRQRLTQTQLAQKIGKDRQYLYKIEKGIVRSNVWTIAVIAEALDMQISKLFEGIE